MDIIESITRFEVANIVIRVWREESEVKIGYPETYDELWDAYDPNNLPNSLLLDRVNAIEVTCNGQGFVYYREWP